MSRFVADFACRPLLVVALVLPAVVARAQEVPPAPPQVVEPAPAVEAAPAVEPAPAVEAAPAVELAPMPPPAPVFAPPPPPAQVPPPPALEEPRAQLDYSDGSFYFRSAHDNLVFVPAARMHLDTYGFAGSGVSDYQRENGTGLKLNLFFRRFIIEMGGLIRGKFFFWVGGNFAPTQVDDVQAPLSSANVYDGFVGYMPTPRLRIYLGQYNAPFTMENVTSSRWVDMMERALSVRTLATPYNKADGLMVWGDTENKSFEYQAGVFGGDGMNRPNVDNRVDGMGRFVVRPLAKREDALKKFHVGLGARVGSRDGKFVQYDAPDLSTPGGYTFWTPSYTQADGTKVHVIPSGPQAAASGEFYLPFERWDVRGEVVYVNEDRREALETTKRESLRGGKFFGAGGYAQLSVWLAGAPRIGGQPAGSYGVLEVPDGLGAQAPMALQLVARGEIVRMNYDANERRGASAGGLSARTNNIDVNAYQVGLNYWATKHVRLTAEYSLYQFPGSAASNQALAPGAKAKTEPDATLLSEISLRVGLSL